MAATISDGNQDSCPIWVKRVVLTVTQPVPVFPDQRTSSDKLGWSVSCHKPTLCIARARSTRPLLAKTNADAKSTLAFVLMEASRRLCLSR